MPTYCQIMYVITLTYVADLESIDAAIPAHAEWLDGAYADGLFIVSGRQVPRVGGVILAAGVDRAVLDARLAQDPFRVLGLATHTVTQFEPTKAAPALGLLSI